MVLWQGLTEGGTAVPVQVTEDGKVIAQGQAGEPGPPGPPGPEGPEGPQGEYGPGDDVEFGSGSFADSVNCQRNGDTHYGYLSADGALDLYRNAVSYAGVIRVWSDVGSTKDLKIGLYSDGSATFEGSVVVNSNGGGTPKIKFWSDGSASLAEGKISLNSTGSATLEGRVTTPEVYAGSVDQYFLGSSYQQTGVGSAAGAGLFRLSDKDGTHGEQQAIRITGSYTQPTGATACIKYDGSAEFVENKCGFTPEGELYFTSRGDRFRVFVQQNICYAEPYTREIELRERLERAKRPDPRDSVGED